jgi:hypothetical protein
MCRGGGSRAQGLVRAGVVPTTPRSLERTRREMSHLLAVLCRPGNFVRFLFEVCWLLSFFSWAWRMLPSSSCNSPSCIEQTAHCDHKPRAAWVFVRMLPHPCSAAGCAGRATHSALVSVSSPYILLEG